jgi:hypothetical protein
VTDMGIDNDLRQEFVDRGSEVIVAGDVVRVPPDG